METGLLHSAKSRGGGLRCTWAQGEAALAMCFNGGERGEWAV